MIEVKAEYVNLQKITKTYKTDYFVYTNVEVKGHAEHTGYTNNIKVCAGVSACCHGIMRLISEWQFNTKIDNGYFRVWLDRTSQFKALDKESVYAINTLVCQLFELYKDYPNAFKSFELIDVKENYEYEKINSSKSIGGHHPFRKGRKRKVGIYPCDEG